MLLGRSFGRSGCVVWDKPQSNVTVGRVLAGPASLFLGRLRGTHPKGTRFQRRVVVVVKRLGRRWRWGRRRVGVVVGVNERKSGGGGGQHGSVGGGSHHHVWQLRLLVRFPRIHGRWRVGKAKAKCGSQSGGGLGMREERRAIGFDR